MMESTCRIIVMAMQVKSRLFMPTDAEPFVLLTPGWYNGCKFGLQSKI